MPAFRGFIALISATLGVLACGRPLKLSKDQFLDTGLHRVEGSGHGEFFVSPDVESVRARIQQSNTVAVRCEVIAQPKLESPGLSLAKEMLTKELCYAFKYDLTRRPRPQRGRAMAPPVRVSQSPAGSGVAVLEVVLINVEGDGERLAPAKGTLLRVRLLEAPRAKPLLQYFYDVGGVAARWPLSDLVSDSLEQLYVRFDAVLDSSSVDISRSRR